MLTLMSEPDSSLDLERSVNSVLKDKTVYVLGADGYIGWPLTLKLAELGVSVIPLDSYAKRRWEKELGVAPLLSVAERERHMLCAEDGDLMHREMVYRWFEKHPPHAVVHLAEQPSAALSMKSSRWAALTQTNNVIGTLNLAFAVKHAADKTGTPPAHIVKLGTMGEYGTPNIPIEEGWLDVEHKGHKDRVLFPKRPGSIYHLSKVHDSHNLEFFCRAWGLRVTDLNQGIVWGHETELALFNSPVLRTSFHYDECFGTIVNRFVCQAALGIPLSIYGSPNKRRGFIHLEDSLRCIVTALSNEPAEGEFRVANQLTEVKSIGEISGMLSEVTHISRRYIPNPRVESEEHPYEVTHDVLTGMGYIPSRFMRAQPMESMYMDVMAHSKELRAAYATLAADPEIKWCQK